MNRTIKRYCKIGFFIVAILVMGLILRPYYDEYIKQDRSETCYKARVMICLDYEKALDEHPEWDLDSRQQAVESICEDYYGTTGSYDPVSGLLVLDNICRSGGKISVRINAENSIIETMCDKPGHPECDWE